MKSMKTAAIYARVSSDQQKEDKTIASQTAELKAFARGQGYSVPPGWIFEDEGFSGATLVRPGLERVRDLAAEGHIQAVLVLSPDRLSRKYAYQVLLTEEWQKHGVETVFVKAPQSQTPEDQLMVQFQGMIAEYERAQILERSRRGKRHRAKQGEVSVLSGAPYGYRYVRKTDERSAYYEVDEAQAEIVRQVFELYTVDGLSIGAITRRLNELAVPTRKRQACWERYHRLGHAAQPRLPRHGLLRQDAGGRPAAASQQPHGARARPPAAPGCPHPAGHAEGPVDRDPGPCVGGCAHVRTGARAAAGQQEILPAQHRRTQRAARPGALRRMRLRAVPHLHAQQRAQDLLLPLPGVGCMALPGAGALHGQAIRLDLLEQTVWDEVARLLEDPALIQAELARRVEAARASDPAKHHQDRVERELLQSQRRIERLLTAYQEGLLSLDELRRRMPELRQHESRLKAEQESLNAQLADQATYLRLTHTLNEFLARLRGRAHALDVPERQRIVRLLVKEVVIGRDTVTIRHSIPTAGRSPGGATNPGGTIPPSPSGGASAKCSLLRTWSNHTALRGALFAGCEVPAVAASGLEHRLEEAQHTTVGHALGYELEQLVMLHRPEVILQIRVNNPLAAALDFRPHLAQGTVGRPPSPVSEAGIIEFRLEVRLQPIEQRLLAHHTRSKIVGTPRFRHSPGLPAFGMGTCLTGWGR